MFVECSEPDVPVESPRVRLRCVYHLEADETYRVVHPPLEPDCRILLLTVGGQGCFARGDLELTLSAGECLCLAPGDAVFAYHTLGTQWAFWWFEFWCQDLELPERMAFQWDGALRQLCRACLLALKQGQAAWASGLLGAILGRLGLEQGCEGAADSGLMRLAQAEEWIRRELAAVTVESLARHMGMSPRTLRGFFAETAHCAPKAYILRIKMEMACWLLEYTSKQVGEIADELGFSSLFHFSRAFRTCCGLSPLQWRKSPQLRRPLGQQSGCRDTEAK